MDALCEPGGSHGGVTLPWRSFLLGAAAIAAYLILGAAPEAWVFDRVAIAQGEWWRLITGHWVHSDLAHAAWDIAALLLLGALFEARLRWRLPLAPEQPVDCGPVSVMARFSASIDFVHSCGCGREDHC